MNEYSDTIAELYGLQQFSIKMGLENITALCKQLNNPQLAYPTIHIAGTNGKGSTAYILQKILSAFNLKTGLYISPHLIDFRERIRINGNLINKDHVCRIWNKLKQHVYSLQATFFDTTTAIALDFFKQEKVDIAIIETGLGGRLDSTNIITPLAVLITPIDIDHSKQLGTDLKEITKEKAGIIKNDVNLFIGRQRYEVYKVLKKYAGIPKKTFYLEDLVTIENTRLHPDYSIFNFFDQLNNEYFKNIHINMASSFQIDNTLLAYLAGRWYLQSVNIPFSITTFSKVMENIYWPGRLDKVSSDPDIYLDVSHNEAGFKNTLTFIKKVFKKKSLHLLIGLLEDKDYKSIVKLLTKNFTTIVITEPLSHRALKGQILKNEFSQYGIKVKLIKDLQKAFDFSIKSLRKEDKLLVIGSHFLVGGLLEKFHKKS